MAVDLNNDGYIDRVYIGDVGGQLWKFDVSPRGDDLWRSDYQLESGPNGQALICRGGVSDQPTGLRRILSCAGHLCSASARL